MPAQKITTHGFLSEFMRQHVSRPDRPICWILGSGASYQSGIPTGGKLARQWLKEMHEMEDFENRAIEEWATEENLGIKGFNFQRAANFYPFIYQRRYRDNREAGYAFLEEAMEDVEPSYGYSVLAQIMASTSHKITITTNFDNLIADALSIYTRSLPLVCGHESLTGYIRPNPRRPVIAKIHRDLLFNPLNNPEELGEMPVGWNEALIKIFDNYTPIVIGYGGNDGSLMGFLKTLPPINGGIFWCYHVESEPEEGVNAVVERHHGRLVPIAGFDEVMLQLWEKLKLPSPIPDFQSEHDKRISAFQKQFEELTTKLKLKAHGANVEAARQEVRVAADAAVQRLTKEESWWSWQLKANAESDPVKKQAIFNEGLNDFPNSAELACNFANFLMKVRKNYDKAEQLYRKAMEIDPQDADYIGNFAIMLHKVRKNYDEAERHYRKAFELNPKHAGYIGNFALFLVEVRKNYDEAERHYRKALELDPKHANNIGNFALFLENFRKNYAEAEQHYRKAIELDPKLANNIGNFAEFLETVRKTYDEAEQHYRKAIELDPKHVNNICNFARFLVNVRKDFDKAEKLYRQAIELSPDDSDIQNAYEEFRKRHPK